MLNKRCHCAECGYPWELPPSDTFCDCPRCKSLNVYRSEERKTKIVCTLGNVRKMLEDRFSTQLKNTITDEIARSTVIKERTEVNLDKELCRAVSRFIEAGMDVARLNMAHFNLDDDEDREYLTKLITTIRTVSNQVAIMGDIPGPKVRIKRFLGQCLDEESVPLKVGDPFILTSKENLPGSISGASIRYQGCFDFIRDIKQNIRSKNDPVEFWFGDGEVILQSLGDEMTPTEILCRTEVPGRISLGQGVSVKNSGIEPRVYKLRDYDNDAKAVEFLLGSDNGHDRVDFFALSFVNSKDDVNSLQEYVKDTLAEENLRTIEERFNPKMHGFPIISKIETHLGFRNIDQILDASYGIMVARGDLALQTTIEGIPILQKRIIEKCRVKGKTVITATQMLSWMMYFREPKRAEATDVANAIFDGTDALMLSEETASGQSKYPVESVDMMGRIAAATESEIKRLNELEYKYKLDQLHDKIRFEFREKRRALQRERDGRGILSYDYEERAKRLPRTESAGHVTYSACKMVCELKCRAIIVLTETGGTARMISRFRPDVDIIAGVHSDEIGRVLQLTYGVRAITIPEGSKQRYPVEQFRELIAAGKAKGLLRTGDRVLTVGGYPPREPGTVTFVNITTVE